MTYHLLQKQKKNKCWAHWTQGDLFSTSQKNHGVNDGFHLHDAANCQVVALRCRTKRAGVSSGSFLRKSPCEEMALKPMTTPKIGIRYMLRPAATRNAQRSVPNADPQRKGPMWISSSIDGVDAFSPGRRKHPKEPYVLKGHVTSNHGTYCSTAWQGLGVNLWGRKKHLEGRLLLMEEILHHGG